MLEIENAVEVVVFIFLKRSGLCRQAISSSQSCSQLILGTNFSAHVTPFACTLCAWS